MRSRPSFGRIAATTLETLAWVGVATALVAILDSVATPAGLGSLYLIAVLAVAIRRGQVAALAAAVLGVLVLNFFFIKPLHQLTIADSDNVVALGSSAARRTGGRAPRRAIAAAGGRGRVARRTGGRPRARGGDARGRGHRPPGRDGRRGRRDLEQPRSGGPRRAPARHQLRTSAERRGDRAPAADRGPIRLALREGLLGMDGVGSEPHRNAARPPARRRRRARARRRPRGRGRGHAAGRRGQDRDPARRLPRPPLAADRDPHGGGGSAGG